MDKSIAIHGLGYVGLTAAVHYARAGWDVLGYDPDASTATLINAGKPRAGEFLSYLNADVKSLVRLRRLRATLKLDEACERKIHVICVPTERAGRPYDGIVEGCLDRLTNSTYDDTLIMIESTLTPGFIDAYRKSRPEFDQRIESGTLHVAVCPRRDWFADPEKNLETLPRIVGGVTDEATVRACQAIETVSRSIHPTDYRTAELTKALENALLHVPVMFAYQLAWALPEHNVAEALRLAGTHWRLMSLYLGFGTGGRCVPLGTEYLVKASESRLGIGMLALSWDQRFRSLIANIVEEVEPRRVLVLGMAYRPEFRDLGLSPGVDVARALRRKNIDVSIHDPLWSRGELEHLTELPTWPLSVAMRQFDVVLLATAHKAYLDLPTMPRMWQPGQIVLDGPGGWSEQRQRFTEMGVSYHRVGEPGWMTLRKGTT